MQSHAPFSFGVLNMKIQNNNMRPALSQRAQIELNNAVQPTVLILDAGMSLRQKRKATHWHWYQMRVDRITKSWRHISAAHAAMRPQAR